MISSLSPTLEDYLEAIWHIAGDSGVARVKDIADKLDVKRSSVTIAMQSLAAKQFIVYSPYSYIQLTTEGKEIAQCVGKRHAVLRAFFEDILQLDSSEAETCACKMEHGMNAQLCDGISVLTNLLKSDKSIKDSLIRKTKKPCTKYECNHNCTCESTLKK